MNSLQQATITVAAGRVSPPASLPARYYRPELDALRLLAFLAVYVHHTVYNISPIASICGGFGLSLFFFLSSFLITELLQRERQASGTVQIKAFYLRRALRIWPLYFTFLLFAYIFGLAYPSHGLPITCMLAYTSMAANWYVSAFGFPATFIAYLWSISIEEQFYLLWPAINSKLSRRALLITMLSIPPLSAAAVLVLCANGGIPAQSIWTNSLVEFQFFALGSLTALLLPSRTFWLRAPVRIALVIAAGFSWTAAACTGIDARVATRSITPTLGYWLVGIGCICLFLTFFDVDQRWIPAWVRYLGKISYGLYVFHQLALEVAEIALNRIPGFDSATHHNAYGIGHFLMGLLITGAFAALSYQHLEKPFLRVKERNAVILSRAA